MVEYRIFILTLRFVPRLVFFWLNMIKCKVRSQWKTTLSVGSQLLALCTMLQFSMKETFTLRTPTLRTSHGKWVPYILSVSQCSVCRFDCTWFLLLTWQAACSAQATEGPNSLRESLRNIYTLHVAWYTIASLHDWKDVGRYQDILSVSVSCVYIYIYRYMFIYHIYICIYIYICAVSSNLYIVGELLRTAKTRTAKTPQNLIWRKL